MIVDHIKNIRKYPQFERYAEAITEFIEKCRTESLPAGRFDLLADNKLYAMLQFNETIPKRDARMESHIKYCDLQYILKGREIIYYDLAENLTVSEDLAAERDVIFYKEQDEKGRNILTEGMFGYYAPQDAHMPGVRCGENAEKTVKIVFKILED